MPHPPHTPISDDLDVWRHRPADAFAAFVMSPAFLELSKRKTAKVASGREPAQREPIRTSSAKVYIAMFGKFLRWLEQHHIALLAVTEGDLMAFLEQSGSNGKKVLNSVIRTQYLGLLERVYTHLDHEANPARHASFAIYRSGSRSRLGSNAAKASLASDQEASFMAALPGQQEEATAAAWKRRRDRAMQAMMLGAGLKVSEVINIHSASVGAANLTGSAPVTISPASPDGTVRAHQTQLRPFAIDTVMQWVAERARLAIPGPLLFPATLNGGKLARATVYRQVKATFERAGIDARHFGGRTLRNAFAIRELRSSAGDIALVGEFLGHRKRRAIEPYSVAAAIDEKA